MKKKRKARRVVLGVGHPWFNSNGKSGHNYNSLSLTNIPVSECGDWNNVSFKFSDVGNWNKCRLVLEVLK